MAATYKWEIEEKYGVKAFTQWRWVPENLKTRGWYEQHGIKIPKDAKPDAVKGGGQTCGKPRISFLFAIEKWWPNYEQERQVIIGIERPKLRTNFE